jgi:hypothetical protein
MLEKCWVNVREPDDNQTNLSKTIHPSVVTYPHHPFITDIPITGRTSRVVNNHGGCPTLHYMDRNIIDPTQGQYFGFATPYRSVPYRYTVSLELLWGHEPRVWHFRVVFPTGGWKEWNKVVWVGIDVVRSCESNRSIVCFGRRDYGKESELVCNGRK